MHRRVVGAHVDDHGFGLGLQCSHYLSTSNSLYLGRVGFLYGSYCRTFTLKIQRQIQRATALTCPDYTVALEKYV